jgi:hypothetical protein
MTLGPVKESFCESAVGPVFLRQNTRPQHLDGWVSQGPGRHLAAAGTSLSRPQRPDKYRFWLFFSMKNKKANKY